MWFASRMAVTVTPYSAAMPLSVSPFTTTWIRAGETGALGAGVAVVGAVGDPGALEPRVLAAAVGVEVADGAADGDGLLVAAPLPECRAQSVIDVVARYDTAARPANAIRIATARTGSRDRLGGRGHGAPGLPGSPKVPGPAGLPDVPGPAPAARVRPGTTAEVTGAAAAAVRAQPPGDTGRSGGTSPRDRTPPGARGRLGAACWRRSSGGRRSGTRTASRDRRAARAGGSWPTRRCRAPSKRSPGPPGMRGTSVRAGQPSQPLDGRG
jgi:hypothetical protein